MLFVGGESGYGQPQEMWSLCLRIPLWHFKFYFVLLNLLQICSAVESFGFNLGNGKVDRGDGYCSYKSIRSFKY